MMKLKITLCALFCGLSALTSAQAQTATPAKKPAAATPAKPAAAASPAPAAGGKTLGGGTATASSPILTREELRACLNQEESIRTRLAAHEANRAPLDKEKADLGTEQTALKEGRGPIEGLKPEADALSLRLKDYAARVNNWNERSAAMAEVKEVSNRTERERSALNKERDALGVEQKALEAEKAAFTTRSENLVASYNAKAAAVDAKVVAWNQRNEQWNQASRALEAERTKWLDDCADRRYREDDENAIKRGK